MYDALIEGKQYEVIGFASQCPPTKLQKLLGLGIIPGVQFHINEKHDMRMIIQIKSKRDTCSLNMEDLIYLNVKALEDS
jgi:Fe2+ transport system protein FeoA